MSRLTDPQNSANRTGQRAGERPAAPPRHDNGAFDGRYVCPFCGAVRDTIDQPCSRCTMEDTPATRQATKARIGPWYVLQTRNPSAPGMRFATLLALVRKGHVTPRSIVRGPTTHQFWKFAARVKGLSREFGLCYGCGEEIDRTANICPACQRIQEPPIDPDTLLEGRTPPPARPTLHREISEDGSEIVLPALGKSASIIPDEGAATMAPPIPPVPTTARPAETEAESEPFDDVPADADDFPMAPPPEPQRRPAAPAPRATGQEILSAKELAAAFQLHFSPPEPEPVERPPRRGVLRKAVAAVLLCGAAVTAAAFYLRPDIRDQAKANFEHTYNDVHQAMTGSGVPQEKAEHWKQVAAAQEKSGARDPQAGSAHSSPAPPPAKSEARDSVVASAETPSADTPRRDPEARGARPADPERVPWLAGAMQGSPFTNPPSADSESDIHLKAAPSPATRPTPAVNMAEGRRSPDAGKGAVGTGNEHVEIAATQLPRNPAEAVKDNPANRGATNPKASATPATQPIVRKDERPMPPGKLEQPKPEQPATRPQVAMKERPKSPPSEPPLSAKSRPATAPAAQPDRATSVAKTDTRATPAGPQVNNPNKPASRPASVKPPAVAQATRPQDAHPQPIPPPSGDALAMQSVSTPSAQASGSDHNVETIAIAERKAQQEKDQREAQADAARQLFNQALDAEGRQAYDEALAIYEQIKRKYPEDVRPGGLDIRIELARDEAKKLGKSVR